MQTFVQENQLFIGILFLLVVGAVIAFHSMGVSLGDSDNDFDSDFGDWD